MGESPWSSLVNRNHCAHRGPIEQPSCVSGTQIDAAVAHGGAKIVVPIGAMQTVPFVKIHHVGDVREEIIRSRHVCRAIFDIDAKHSCDGYRRPGTGGNNELVYDLIAHHSEGPLGGEIYVNPAFIRSNLGGARARSSKYLWFGAFRDACWARFGGLRR